MNKNMQEFLRVRPTHRNDAEAAKAIGLLPSTVYKWKSHSDPDVRSEFLATYAKVIAAREQAITDINSQVNEELRPAALDRYRELIPRPITKDTSPAEMRVVKDAAKDVLEKTGDLGGPAAGANAIQLFFTEVNVNQDGSPMKPDWNLGAQIEARLVE